MAIKKECKQLSLFDLSTTVNLDTEKKEFVENYFVSKRLIESEDTKNKDIMFCIPPSSIVYDFVEAFREGTDFPLEIPFFTLFHYISAFLLNKNVKYNFANEEHEVDIWSLILGESSSGKTTVSKQLEKVLDSKQNLQHTIGITSSAVLKEELRDNNRKLIFKDEVGQFFKLMKTQPNMMEMKDIFLRVYDHSDIEYKTKKESFVIKNPAISFIGVNTPEAFIKDISIEDMSDGFMQRFSVVFADWDPNRPVQSRMMFDFSMLEKCQVKFQEMLNNVSVEKFVFSEEAEIEYEKAFSMIVKDSKSVPRSFVRRIMYRLTKYAVLYHILLGKGNTEKIDKEDIIYASRVSFLLLKNNIRLIETHKSDTDIVKVIEAVKKVRDKMVKRKGKCTASDIIQNVRYFRDKSAAQVKSFFSMLESYNQEIKL